MGHVGYCCVARSDLVVVGEVHVRVVVHVHVHVGVAQVGSITDGAEISKRERRSIVRL